MKILIIAVGLITYITVSLCTWGIASDLLVPSNELNAIGELSRKSQATDLKCRTFLTQVRTKTLDSEKMEFFSTRPSALLALKVAPQYPGTPLATSEALDRFLNLAELPKGVSADDLWVALRGLSDCHSVEFFGVLIRLMDSRTQKVLLPQEVALIHTVVMNYLKRETHGGPRFLLQTEELIRLTARGSREHVLHFPIQLQNDLDNLEWKISKLNSEEIDQRQILEQASALTYDPSSTQKALDELERQLDQSDDLREDLYFVLKRESAENKHSPKIDFGPIQLMRLPTAL